MGTETPIKGERNDSLEELRDNQRGLTTKALGERERHMRLARHRAGNGGGFSSQSNRKRFVRKPLAV